MKRQCKRTRKYLWNLLDKEITPEEKDEIHQHAEACEECRRVLQLNRRVDQTLQAEEIPDLSEKFITDVHHAIQKRSRQVARDAYSSLTRKISLILRRVWHARVPAVPAAFAVLAVILFAAITVLDQDHVKSGLQEEVVKQLLASSDSEQYVADDADYALTRCSSIEDFGIDLSELKTRYSLDERQLRGISTEVVYHLIYRDGTKKAIRVRRLLSTLPGSESLLNGVTSWEEISNTGSMEPEHSSTSL